MLLTMRNSVEADEGVTVVKIGSTSVAVFSAVHLQEPRWHQVWTLGLLTDNNLEAALAPVLTTIAAAVGRRVLVGVGELGRARPELAFILGRWGWPVWWLSGDEEARCTWWGVQAGRNEPVTVIDVGGGSTEVCDGRIARSWPFGAHQPPADVLAVAADRCHITLGGPAVAVGGTAVAMGRVLGADHLTRAQLQSAYQDPALVERARSLGLEPRRVALLSGGVAALLHAMTWMEVPAVEISPRGLVHGLWLAARLGRMVSDRHAR